MDEKFFVYKHTNKINKKVYIGITCRPTPEMRWGKDGCGYRTSPYFYSAIVKYGWDGFDHEILYEGLTKEEAVKKEQELISEYRANNRLYGYNSTSGGEHFELTPEARKKKSESMKGNKNSAGVIFSEERKRKISEALKGKKFTEERKQKISQVKKGKTHKTINDEGKNHLSNSPYHNAKKKRVYCEETKEVFSSIHECAEKMFSRKNATAICAVCRGRVPSYKNYHFYYIKEEEYQQYINAERLSTQNVE